MGRLWAACLSALSGTRHGLGWHCRVLLGKNSKRVINIRGQSELYIKVVLMSGVRPLREHVWTTPNPVANGASLSNNEWRSIKSKLAVVVIVQEGRLSFGIGNFRIARGMET